MMKMKRISTIAVLALTASAAHVVTSAGPAAASFQCNGMMLNGGSSICIDYDPQGYRAGYLTSYGPRGDWMDFNLRCDSGVVFGDNGAFLADKVNHWYTYIFKVGNQGRCHVTLFDRSTGGERDSPSVSR